MKCFHFECYIYNREGCNVNYCNELKLAIEIHFVINKRLTIVVLFSNKYSHCVTLFNIVKF